MSSIKIKSGFLIIEKICTCTVSTQKNDQSRQVKTVIDKALRGQSLEASVCNPLWSRLSSTLLQLMAELLGVRILQ